MVHDAGVVCCHSRQRTVLREGICVVFESVMPVTICWVYDFRLNLVALICVRVVSGEVNCVVEVPDGRFTSSRFFPTGSSSEFPAMWPVFFRVFVFADSDVFVARGLRCAC